MKFSINGVKQAARQTGSMDLIEAAEGLTNAWEDLTVAQKGMSEVCDIMDNIQESLEHLRQYGNKSVPVLNIDKGLELLLGIPEKLITAEKAQEGLGEAAKKVWDTLVEWCKKIWEAIANFFKKIVQFFTDKSDANEKKLEDIQKRVEKGKSTEGLSASLETTVQLAGGGEMTYWKIGKFDTAIDTLFLTQYFYPEIILGCAFGILKIGTDIQGKKKDLSKIQDAYGEAIAKLSHYCKTGLDKPMLVTLTKLEFPQMHGLDEINLGFPSQFSAPSNIDSKKLNSSGWNAKNLMDILRRLKDSSNRAKTLIIDKTATAEHNTQQIGVALARYNEGHDDISETKVYLQCATTAASNLMQIMRKCVLGFRSVETGLIRVADEAAKALGF